MSLNSKHRFGDFSPNPFDPENDFVGAPGWADAGVILPYDLWVVYGDKRQMEITLPAATAFAATSARPYTFTVIGR